MKFSETVQLGATVHWFDEVSSTNATLEAMWRDDPQLAHETLVVTANQTAGRGRQGRGWDTTPGKALAASMLVRGFRGMSPTWLPLLVGSAVARATQPWFPSTRIAVKWPNDVHALVNVAADLDVAADAHAHAHADADANEDAGTKTRAMADQAPGNFRLGAKLNGILCQLVAPETVIVGVGTNLFLTADELPTERAGSWVTEGARVAGSGMASAGIEGAGTEGDPLAGHLTVTEGAGARIADTYLAAFVTELRSLVALAESDPDAVRCRIMRDSATIGTRVRVFLPGGSTLHADALSLTQEGALVVRTDDGTQHTVHAGDVEHLREG